MIGTKITKQKQGLQWVFCFVVACFLFTTSISAQNYPNLVSEAQAITLLEAEIPVLENTMNNATPGSSAFILAERTYQMYMHTWETISIGRNVEEALTSSFGEFAIDANGNSRNEDELPQVSKTGFDYGDSVFDNLVSFLEI